MSGHQRWKCVCGAVYGQHFKQCTRCDVEGWIRPWYDRPHAQLDFTPALTDALSLSKMTRAPIDHAAYPDVAVQAGAFVRVEGLPGAGKSSWAGVMANSFKCTVLYVAAEESASPALAERFRRCGIVRKDFLVLSRASVDQVVATVNARKARVCVLDSVQEAAWSPRECRHLLEVSPTLDVLIGVVQSIKSGEAAGPQALLHECDVSIHVEDFRWSMTRSRYQNDRPEGDVFVSPSPAIQAVYREAQDAAVEKMQ